MMNFLIFCLIHLVDNIDDESLIFGNILILVFFILTFGTTLFILMQIVSHFKLITVGVTTNEFINMFRYNYFRDAEGNLRNPFKIGCIQNWTIFCFGSCNKK